MGGVHGTIVGRIPSRFACLKEGTMRTDRVGLHAGRWMLCVLGCLTLAACGGGGGSGSSSTGTSGSGSGSATTYTIGGQVSGLSASGLALDDNGGNTLTVSANSTTFTFTTMLASGATYDVTVATQPTGQTCTVSSGTGTVSGNVTSVMVSCATNTYSIGGNITGLNASGLVLQDNGGDNLTVNSGSSTFTFATKLATGKTYAVTVATQPTGETCTVSSGTGTVATSNVTSVGVACTVNTFTITGSATGLTSAGLKLQFYTGGQVLSVAPTASGAASYTDSNVPYGSSILTNFIYAQPSWETCTENSGDYSGLVTQNVTAEDLTCAVLSATATTLTTGVSLKAPQGVAVDSSGNVFVADSAANAIYEISGGTATPLATQYSFSSPIGVAVDSSGNVYVADYGDSKILEIVAINGVVSSSSKVQQLAGSTPFSHPDGVAVDSKGDVFVADTGDDKIDEIAPGAATATVLAGSTVAGCVDANGTSAEFDSPTGIAVDSSGNLYVADHNNNVIREITSVGTNNTVTLLAGGGAGYTCNSATVGANNYLDGTGTAAEFSGPTDVTVDSAGNVFVVDNGNNAVREVTPQGVVTTVAGTTLPSGSKGTVVSFNSPWGIAEDTSSDLYVADTGSASIIQLKP